MRNKQRIIYKKELQLRCPACKAIHDSSSSSALGPRGEVPSSPTPGDLTECRDCKTMLEYQDGPISLTLHRASKERVNQLNAFTKSDFDEPRLSKLVEFARKHRRMPGRPPIGYQFRKTQVIERTKS